MGVSRCRRYPTGSSSVRQVASEGAYAIGVQLLRAGLDANVVTAATKDLRACFNMAGADELAGLILEALGLARYEKADEIRETENFLAQQSHGTAMNILGAVKGLEALLRQHPKHEIGEDARIRLRQLVTYGASSSQPAALDADARIRRLAFMALQAARDSRRADAEQRGDGRRLAGAPARGRKSESLGSGRWPHSATSSPPTRHFKSATNCCRRSHAGRRRRATAGPSSNASTTRRRLW